MASPIHRAAGPFTSYSATEALGEMQAVFIPQVEIRSGGSLYFANKNSNGLQYFRVDETCPGKTSDERTYPIAASALPPAVFYAFDYYSSQLLRLDLEKQLKSANNLSSATQVFYSSTVAEIKAQETNLRPTYKVFLSTEMPEGKITIHILLDAQSSEGRLELSDQYWTDKVKDQFEDICSIYLNPRIAFFREDGSHILTLETDIGHVDMTSYDSAGNPLPLDNIDGVDFENYQDAEDTAKSYLGLDDSEFIKANHFGIPLNFGNIEQGILAFADGESYLIDTNTDDIFVGKTCIMLDGVCQVIQEYELADFMQTVDDCREELIDGLF